MKHPQRIRRIQTGFVGVNLAKAGDMSLYKRLQKEAEATTMSQSLIIRLALIDYLDKQDADK